MDYKRNLQLLEKIRQDYDAQLKKLEYNSDKYIEIKESRNETLEKMFSLMYRETD